MAMTAMAFFSTQKGALTPDAEERFFRSIKVRNRNTKQTAAGRLSELDELLLRHIALAGRPIRRVLDIGVSSGVTTLELYTRLAAAGNAPRVTGTDLVLEATIVPVLPGCRALIDDTGDVLQYDLLGLAMRPWRRRLDYVNGFLLFRSLVEAVCAPRARRALARPASACRRVRLIAPRILSEPNIEIIADDILVANPSFERGFDVVRVANILNREYFTPPILQTAAGNVVRYLAGPGSLLLVGRTHERSGNDATLFELQEDGVTLAAAERLGAGSEIESVVLDAAARQAR